MIFTNPPQPGPPRPGPPRPEPGPLRREPGPLRREPGPLTPEFTNNVNDYERRIRIQRETIQDYERIIEQQKQEYERIIEQQKQEINKAQQEINRFESYVTKQFKDQQKGYPVKIVDSDTNEDLGQVHVVPNVTKVRNLLDAIRDLITPEKYDKISIIEYNTGMG